MKKHCSLTVQLSSILLFVFIFLISQKAYSEMFAGTNSIEPQDPKSGTKPSLNFYTYCYDTMTGQHLPCPFEVTLWGESEDCPQPGPDTQCGHVDAYHTPSSRNNLPENKKVVVLGWITDQWQQSPATQLPERQTTWQNPDYSFTYYAGVLSGNVQVRNFSSRPPAGYYFLSPPCESKQTCTVYSIMEVGYKGFFEMPAPLPRRSSTPELDDPDWDGYVRCGKTANCTEPVVDNPYNWPAHPQVHWGEEYLLDNLWCLGREWYAECGTDLVISDMSLPKGGLLDVNQDWSTPHKTHRRGTDADISSKSVPTNGICGPRPSGGTFDPVWEKTILRKIAIKNCELRPLKGDPGHLVPIGK